MNQNKIKQTILNVGYMIIIIFVLILFKLNISFGILIYPYIIYLISKKNNPFFSFLLNFIIGNLIFVIVFFWSNTIDFKLILFPSILSGLIFGITGLITSYIFKNINLNQILKILLIPSLLYLFKLSIFNQTLKIKYFLDIPFFLGVLSNIIGSSGINYFLFIISISIGIFITKKEWKKIFILGLIFITLFSINLIKYETQETNLTKIGIIQGNFDYSFEWREKYSLTTIYEYYIKETINLAKKETKIIIWPEYAIANDFSKNDKILLDLQNLTNYYNFTLVLGSYIDENDVTRKDVSYVITPNQFLKKYEAQILYKGLSDGWKLKEGNNSILYKTDQGNFLILICYEELFREILWTYPMDEVDYIIIIANNQLINNKYAFETLIWNMQDIAASYQKYVISSTNTGPSAIVKPNGEVITKLPYFKKGSLTYEIPIYEKKTNTFYARHNEIVIQIFILMFFTYLFYYSINVSNNVKKK